MPKCRLYTTPPTHQQESHPAQKPKPAHTPAPKTRHEVHEGTESLNMPFNPPGGGPNPFGRGMSSSFTDAMLTTFIGLGAGK